MKKFATLLLVGVLSVGSMIVPVQAKTAKKAVNVSAMQKTIGACAVSGKNVYYVKTKSGKKTATTIYKCTLKGNNSVKVNTFSGRYTIGAVYNGKLYMTKGTEINGYKTYAVSKLGKGKMTLVKKNLNVYDGKGKYMIGTSKEPTDVGPKALCIYNAATNKKQSLGEGYCPTIIGKRVYYASWNSKQKRYVVAYNVLGSTTKHIVAKFPKASLVVVNSVSKNKASYYINYKNTIKNKTLRY